MKSVKSSAVFTRQNPFQPASSVKKTNYHSSSTQSLSKKNKKTTLSPVRSNQQDNPQVHTFEKPDHHLTTTDGQPTFAESWASTDSRSSPNSITPSSGMKTTKQSAGAGKSIVSSELGNQDSVLAKYMERFRCGQPQSREERHQVAIAIGEDLPFWWMPPSSSPPSSTPTKTTGKDDHRAAIFTLNRTPSPRRGPHSILSDTSQGEFNDTEILHLQERAGRLLQRGECTLSDESIPVSPEGMACSDFSSPVSVDEPTQRPLIPSLIQSTAKARSGTVQAVPSQQSSGFPSLVPPTRPQDDILFQWRLRRKMEQAREWSQSQQHSSLRGSTFSWQGPSLCHPSANGQACKQHQSVQPPETSKRASYSYITAPQSETNEDQGPCPTAFTSGSTVPEPQYIAHIPAHMHLLCDVLPCPIQSSNTQQSISQRLDESLANVVTKETQNPRNSMYTSADELIRKHIPSPPPTSSTAIQGEWPIHHKKTERNKQAKPQIKDLEKNEQKTVVATRKQKKLSSGHADGPTSTNRSSSHQRVSKKIMSRTEQHQQEFSSESCTVDHAPPPSPIHSALGQVVSEVLFPAMDSSPAQETPVSPVSPPCTASAPPQSPVTLCNTHNSMEVISQLLQEAEDSDEKEFEDDPLLQVLRKQRKWVTEQISEVDAILDEFLDEQQVI
ncbi:hypothetical protein PAMP_002445 [Pampus punctatissimus]